MAQRPSTATSNFGVNGRQSHDATGFYSRFTTPVLSTDDLVNKSDPSKINRIYARDARSMPEVEDGSVALVVTSPPYFAGKEYEEAMGEGHVPGSYLEYLQLLSDVFAECVHKLESGGRIAVNIANLGRKPYRSLAADVIEILQNQLKLLLRGEIIWVKGKGAGNSTAWGSFQSAANPVLRDVSERIIVASKGRFDRAIPRKERAQNNLPSDVTISKDHFMEATLDIWDLPPESATRVGHPAPFPVELPQRLIELYTYRKDLILDPFIGSGSSAVAAVRTERNFVGYDTDPSYRDIAERRVAEEHKRLEQLDADDKRQVILPAIPTATADDDEFQSRAVREGQAAKEIAEHVLESCGFQLVASGERVAAGVEINFVATDQQGRHWYFDVSGAFTSLRAGLRRTDTLWKAIGKAAVLKSSVDNPPPLVFLTTDLPPKGSAGDTALKAARGKIFLDAIDMLSQEGQAQLREYSTGGSLLPSGTAKTTS